MSHTAHIDHNDSELVCEYNLVEADGYFGTREHVEVFWITRDGEEVTEELELDLEAIEALVLAAH